jgi:predicted nucleotidyltransferase component of viral defense system
LELVYQRTYRHSARRRRLKANYPSDLDGIRPWARDNSLSFTEARTRFAQYAILEAIASSRVLHDSLVFKGGNALDFIWHPNRSTQDLDFSFDSAKYPEGIDEKRLKVFFEGGLRIVRQSSGLMSKIGAIKRQPPGADKDLTTYRISVHYAYPDQRQYRLIEIDPDYRGPPAIPVEISTYEPICGVEHVQLHAGHSLRVCSLDDIVAEKLRALLQQPIRNRTRRQDLLDIAVIVIEGQELHLEDIRRYLLRKASAVNVPVSRAAFHNPEIMRRAHQDYDALRATVRANFVPFEDARNAVYSLVDALALPEESTG